MATRKKTRKDEEEILVDVVEVRDNTVDFFEKNKTLIIALITLLIVVVGGYLVYKYLYMEPKEKEASAAIYKAEYQFQRDSFALALENPGGGFEGFLDIIENYNGTKAANLSRYYAGICYLNEGRYQEAITYLEDYSPSGSITPIMKYGALGDAYAENGDLNTALSMYGKASSSSDNNFLTPYYLGKLGMLSAKQGDNSAAISAFEKIKNNYPNSNELQDAERFLARLKG